MCPWRCSNPTALKVWIRHLQIMGKDAAKVGGIASSQELQQQVCWTHDHWSCRSSHVHPVLLSKPLHVPECVREGRVNTAAVSTLWVGWESQSSHVSDPQTIIWNWSHSWPLCLPHWHSHKKTTTCVQQYLIYKMAPGSSTERGGEQIIRSSSLNLVCHTIGVIFL